MYPSNKNNGCKSYMSKSNDCEVLSCCVHCLLAYCPSGTSEALATTASTKSPLLAIVCDCCCSDVVPVSSCLDSPPCFEAPDCLEPFVPIPVAMPFIRRGPEKVAFEQETVNSERFLCW